MAIATLAIFGTGVTNTVVAWVDRLGNSSSDEIADNSAAIAANDLTPIQRAGRFVQRQTEPFTTEEIAPLFQPEEIAQATDEAPAPAAAQAPAPTPAAADTSIPALW